MTRSRLFERLALAGLSLAVAWLAFTRESQVKPPLHDGPAFQTEPSPIAPQAILPAPANPMALLAERKPQAAARASSFNRSGGNDDTIKLPPGQEVTLADLRGPGAITHIWTTFRGKGRDIVLRFYWEGSDHPSVEAPIGDFFGVAMGIDANVESYPIQVSAEGRARNCWWHMPFNASARVTATNAIPAGAPGAGVLSFYYYIDYEVFGRPIKDIQYFHARLLETAVAERGRMVKLADVEGRGHFVGLVMGQRARTQAWFGEGDDVITVDGKLSFAGTGTEDYFCDAWGFRVFSDLYHGVPVYEGRHIGDRLSAYRFHINDPIPFRSTFSFQIEHWPNISALPNSGRDYYSGLAFWYQDKIHKPWPRLDKLVSNEPWDPIAGRWHIPGAFEAEDLAVLDYRSRALEDTRPPLDIKFNTESRDVLRSLLRYGPRPTPLFLMPNLSGDEMVVFDAGGDGAFSLGLPVKEEGVYDLKVYYGRAEDYGIVELSVDGRPAGEPVDLFAGLGRPFQPPQPRTYAAVPLKAGLNALTFTLRTKNAGSLGTRIGIDCVVVEKSQGHE